MSAQPAGDSPNVIPIRPEQDPVPEAHPAVPGPGKRLPVIPEPWQRANLRATLRRLGGLWFHRIRFHGLRAPAYLILLAWYSLAGTAVLAGRLVRWWQWTEGHVLESQAVAAGRAGHHDAMRAHTQGLKTRGQRGRIVLVCAGLGIGLLLAGIRFLPWYGWALAAVAAVLVLARHGKPAGRLLVGRAVVPPEFEQLTDQIIFRALGALGLAGIDKVLREGRQITLVSPVTRDGPGWRVEIDLPYGVTVTEIVERREKLASGLRRPVTCVWPEPATDEHAGRLVLYVSDLPLRRMRQPAYPIAKAGRASLFAPLTRCRRRSTRRTGMSSRSAAGPSSSAARRWASCSCSPPSGRMPGACRRRSAPSRGCGSACG